MKHVLLTVALAVGFLSAPGFAQATESGSRDYLDCYTAIGVKPVFTEEPEEITSPEQLDNLVKDYPGLVHLLLQNSTLERVWVGKEVRNNEVRPTALWTEGVIRKKKLVGYKCQMEDLLATLQEANAQ